MGVEHKPGMEEDYKCR